MAANKWVGFEPAPTGVRRSTIELLLAQAGLEPASPSWWRLLYASGPPTARHWFMVAVSKRYFLVASRVAYPEMWAQYSRESCALLKAARLQRGGDGGRRTSGLRLIKALLCLLSYITIYGRRVADTQPDGSLTTGIHLCSLYGLCTDKDHRCLPS